MSIKRSACPVRESGFQIIEVLLAIAVVSIVILPMINLLNTIYFGMRKELEPGAVIRETIYSIPYFGKQCRAADILGKAIASGNSSSIQVDMLSHADLSLSSTTQISGVTFNGFLLQASLDSSSTTEPDFATYDFSEYAKSGSKEIPVLTAIDTGPGYAGHVSEGSFAYGANLSVLEQGHMFDSASAGSSVDFSSRYIIPGSDSHTNPIPKKILIHKELVVVGTQKSPLQELVIFDKLTGKVLSNTNTDYGINDMLAFNEMLFVLGPQDPELVVYDIADPSNPIQKTSVDFPGGSGNGRSSDVFGNVLYVGRSKGGNEFMSFGLGEEGLEEIAASKIGSSVDEIVGSMYGALIVTSNEAGELYFVRHNKSVMSDRFQVNHLNVDLPGRASDYACLGNMIFIPTKSADFPLSVLRIKKDD